MMTLQRRHELLKSIHPNMAKHVEAIGDKMLHHYRSMTSILDANKMNELKFQFQKHKKGFDSAVSDLQKIGQNPNLSPQQSTAVYEHAKSIHNIPWHHFDAESDAIQKEIKALN